MKSTFAFNILLLVEVLVIQDVLSAPETSRLSRKVFNYQGSMPIKDDRTGQTISAPLNVNEANATTSSDTSEAEAACWKLINEQSAVTFALQKKVLDELNNDMKNLTVDQNLATAVAKIDSRLRNNMDEALDALKRDAADEFFDALFDTSEDIIALSSLVRDPKLPDDVFLTLVKAVSRLGRNNSALIQEFTDMCSFVHRSPRPRTADLGL